MGSIAPPSENGSLKLRRVYLITMPRTASNLFVKIINSTQQPEVSPGKFYGGYFFMPPYEMRGEYKNWDVPVNSLSEEHKEKLGASYQQCADRYREHLESAEKDGKIAFVKEHVNLLLTPALQDYYMHGTPVESTPSPWTMTYYKDQDVYSPTNPTIVPDNLLTSFLPTLLIRHPAIQFPSLYRAHHDALGGDDGPSSDAISGALFKINGMRRIHDFLKPHFTKTDPSGPWPVIYDAADFITHPATVIKHFCDLTGFDFAHCQFRWEVFTTEQQDAIDLNKAGRRMLDTINASTGIRTDKAMADIDVDVEAKKWRVEFGEKVGAQMEKWVRDAMPDYNYLWEKRWDPVGKEAEVAGETTSKK